MTCCLPLQTMARTILIIAAIALGVILLSGCDMDSYSEDIRYPVRTDPIVNGSLQGTPDFPDQPGRMPLMSILDLADAKHPLNNEEQGKFLDPNKVGAEQRRQLQQLLEEKFGTPAHPKVQGLESGALAVLKVDEATLAEGSQLYRRHCLHCHGLSGDGRGPTAPWVNPHPRDYRQGMFKFTSSKQSLGERKARREDLLRTLRQGIEGTSMPSFVLLADKDLEALISYVIHLSLRGEVEFDTLKTILSSSLEGTLTEAVQTRITVFGQRWVDSQQADNFIVPEAYPYDRGNQKQMRESVQRGWQLFKQPGEASCIGCHLDYGRKNQFRFDSWGTLVRPIDFTLGIYRGGRRPIDLYWRIYGGINGAFMASYEGLRPDDQQQAQKTDKLWDLVNFIQVLPYPKMRQEYGIDIDEVLAP